MKCPIDGTELKIADRQDVEIDYCPQCRGVWLDRGELDKIIARADSFDKRDRYRDDDYDDDVRQRSARSTGIADIVGEVLKEQPRRKQDDRYRDDRYRGNHYRADDRYRKKKKSSLLGELFDF